MTQRATESRDDAPFAKSHRGIIVCVIALGFAARVLAALIGDNYDMESWWIASEGIKRGEAIYTVTHRYNYGPAWAWMISCARSIGAALGSDTITTLHLLLTAALSLVDLALASILYRTTSPLAGLLFFLNPISIAVTGYHIQFDNFAILLALLAWRAFTRAQTPQGVFTAALLLGASLSLKHVFILFLGWLPFLSTIRTLRERLFLAVIAATVFLGSFTPWIGDSAAWNGIRANVFGYVSSEGHSLTGLLAELLPGLSPRFVFMLLTTVAGVALTRRPRLQPLAPYLYLITLVALSSGMARNYLAVPLVGLFALPWSVCSSLYMGIATLALVTVHPALGVSEVVAPLLSWSFITYELAQVALLGCLVSVWVRLTATTEPTQRSESPQTP